MKNVQGCHIQDDNTADQYMIFKDQHLCTIDEHYASDSIQNANRIELPHFMVTTLQVAKKRVRFWHKYCDYPNLKCKEYVTLLFYISYEKKNEYSNLYGNGFKCHYQGDHYIANSPSVLISQICASRGTPCRIGTTNAIFCPENKKKIQPDFNKT